MNGDVTPPAADDAATQVFHDGGVTSPLIKSTWLKHSYRKENLASYKINTSNTYKKMMTPSARSTPTYVVKKRH